MTGDTFKIPESCPICSAPLTIEGDFLYCRSRSCPNQLTGAIKVWVKRLGLLQWGDSLIESLTDPNDPKISSIADLYRLSIDQIALCSSGMKVAKKCYDILHANKDINLELLLASLNIPNLAISTATDIVYAGYNTVEKIVDLTYEQLVSIQNIGDVTARQILDGISQKRDLIIELSTVVNLKVASGALSGKSFCITGSTSKPRKAVEKMILDNGGIVKSSVGAGLSYLITNDSTTGSSKMQNAKKHGVCVISESDLHTLIGRPDARTVGQDSLDLSQ